MAAVVVVLVGRADGDRVGTSSQSLGVFMTSHYDIQYLYIQTGAMEREGLCGGARRREKGWQNIYDVWSDEKRVVVVVVGASLFRAGASLFLSIRPVAFHFYVRVRNQENGSH